MTCYGLGWRNGLGELPFDGFGVFELFELKKIKPLIVNRKGLLGVEIGSAAVKVLALSRSSGRYRVESCALEPLPPNAVTARQFSDVDEVGEALRRTRARLRSRRRHVAVGVGGPVLIAKHIACNAALTDAEILDRITADAGRHIPFPLDEVAIDFEVLGLSERQPDQADVLLVACRQRSIDGLRAAMLAAGFTLAVVEPQTQAVERMFRLFAPDIERQAGELVVAVADVGATVVTLWVLVDGRAIFNREQTLGGEPLVSTPPPEQAATDSALADDTVRGLSQALRYFYSSTHYGDIDRLLLIGDAANTPGLAGALQKALGVPAAVADPFAKLSFAPGVDVTAVSENAPALAMCCGLAMRGCT